jgi:hypothetical protein
MAKPRPSKVKAWWNRLWNWSWDWWRHKPFFLLLVLAALPFLVEQIAPEFVIMTATAWGVSKLELLFILICALLLIAMVSWIVFLVTRPPDPLPRGLLQPEMERLTHLDDAGVRRVQAEIVDPCFPGVYPNEDDILKMYRKNPVMGVAIHSRKENVIVAFACAWPLRAKAAEQILAGKKTENDLEAEDVLPSSANRRATHLLIPVIVVRNPGEKQGIEQNYTLRAAFRDLVCDVYYGDSSRAITFMATGFTQSGIEYCKLLQMSKATEVTMDGKRVPIYSRSLTLQEFKRIF